MGVKNTYHSGVLSCGMSVVVRSHRCSLVIVMFDGKIVGEKTNQDVTDREIGLLMAGIS